MEGSVLCASDVFFLKYIYIFKFLFIYSFFGCVGSLLLRVGFL